MRVLAILLCLTAFTLNGQEAEFEQMLSIRQIHVSGMESLYSGIPNENIEAGKSKAVSHSLFAPEEQEDSQLQKKSLITTTYLVTVQYYNGYLFHIADYLDGTRVVTCLDGPLVGLQGISINGVKISESYDVEWYTDYFVHFYSNGLIYSYTQKQIMEIY